jgi:hypothetical protein
LGGTIPHRKNLLVTPQAGLTPGDRVRREPVGDGVQVVAREERFAHSRQPNQLLALHDFSGACALEVAGAGEV